MQQNIAYYNEIADQYDATLDKDKSNEIVRQQVAAVFGSLVPSGVVLDFGGGTGKDLEWLTRKGYEVVFCEPSGKMREKAGARVKEWFVGTRTTATPATAVSFLDDFGSNFMSWQIRLPFSQKADAVLGNFAVINNITEIELLFKNLSLVTRQGSHLLFLVLKSNFKTRWRSNRKAALLSLVKDNTVTIDTKFNQQLQKVHLYTTGKIRKAASIYFNFHSSSLIKSADFILIHLTRK